MKIQHNLLALNTNRQLGIHQGKYAKNIERLSTGYRINRAADDAAGLTISEKMWGQIRGLNRASKNVQDGISLIQTAEGALQSAESKIRDEDMADAMAEHSKHSIFAEIGRMVLAQAN